mmetsp:Transcript_1860/g.5062  ORF Transcript_1860/g.5062 Transcript_1860/m.5062 type:complete len:124 (-) Transcript_1860:439-810(-)
MKMDEDVILSIRARMTAEIHPSLLGGSMIEAAREKLDSLVLKWHRTPQWEGAVLSYGDEELAEDGQGEFGRGRKDQPRCKELELSDPRFFLSIQFSFAFFFLEKVLPLLQASSCLSCRTSRSW